jgi:hypothetical protein
MIANVIMYGCKCDNCSKEWKDPSTGISAFSTMKTCMKM